MKIGNLEFEPALEHPELLAEVVHKSLLSAKEASVVLVAPIDPSLSDTAALCSTYGVAAAQSANCVVLKTKKGAERGMSACLILANTRADINGKVCETLQVKGASFAPMEDAVRESQMEFGAIGPIGLPADWAVLIDSRVASSPYVIIGSGKRGSKIAVPGSFLATLPNVQIVEGLATLREEMH